MESDLSNKHALVPGDGCGIGRTVAERLAASGAAVALMWRGQRSLDEAVRSIEPGRGR